jgi:hypothetical protein
MSNAFLVGTELLGQIRRTVGKSEGEVARLNVTRRSGVLGGGDEVTPEPAAFRICTFTGAWAINTTRAVRFYNSPSATNTIAAVNLLLPVPSLSTNTNNPTICCIARDAGTWLLVNVLHQEQDVVTGVNLMPNSLDFSRRSISSVGRTISDSQLPLASCENRATPAQLTTFLG